MGLNTPPHYPCLLYGVLDNPSSPETISAVQSQLHVGLCVENFVFYSSDPTHEALIRKSKSISWEMLTISWVLHLLGSKKNTGKSLSIYANWNSLNSQLIGSWFTVLTSFPILLHIVPGSPSTPLIPLTPSTLILHVEDRSISVMLAA